MAHNHPSKKHFVPLKCMIVRSSASFFACSSLFLSESFLSSSSITPYSLFSMRSFAANNHHVVVQFKSNQIQQQLQLCPQAICITTLLDCDTYRPHENQHCCESPLAYSAKTVCHWAAVCVATLLVVLCRLLPVPPHLTTKACWPLRQTRKGHSIQL